MNALFVSIAHILGSLGGTLYPEDLASRALVDELLASIEDVFGIVLPYHFEQDADKKKELAKGVKADDKLPYWIKKIEKRLAENEARGNKNGFFVGDALTVGDLKVYTAMEFIDYALADIDLGEQLKPVPKLTAFMKKIDAMDKIQEFKAMFKEQQEKSPAPTQVDPAVTEHMVKGKNVYIEM